MNHANMSTGTIVPESYVNAFSAHDEAGERADAVHTSLELIDELYEYNHWIFTKVRPFIRGAVCEVGSGIGNITQFLLNQPRVVCLEPHAPSRERARGRFADHLNIAIEPFLLQECPREGIPAGSFDSIVCLNVLEHIEDDISALGTMRELCRPGGDVFFCLCPNGDYACSPRFIVQHNVTVPDGPDRRDRKYQDLDRVQN